MPGTVAIAGLDAPEDAASLALTFAPRVAPAVTGPQAPAVAGRATRSRTGYLVPSSFECDCGHRSHFFEGTVNEMVACSRRSRKPIQLWDSEAEEHAIEFRNGRAVAVICPKLGRREITGWA